MLKKVFCVLVSLLLVWNLTMLAIAEEKNMTVLHDCNTAFGSFKVETDSEHENCLAYHFTSSADSFVNEVTFAPIDASEADTLAMDIYLSDPEMLSNMTQLYIEITSSGQCDHQENAWAAHSVLPTRKLQAGWNTVYFYLTESNTTDGACDLSAINYIRIFSFFDAAAMSGETIKFDNIRMIYTGEYDYSDLSLNYYSGDNSDVQIRIIGQQEPDLENRHANITVTAGRSVQ